MPRTMITTPLRNYLYLSQTRFSIPTVETFKVNSDATLARLDLDVLASAQGAGGIFADTLQGQIYLMGVTGTRMGRFAVLDSGQLEYAQGVSGIDEVLTQTESAPSTTWSFIYGIDANVSRLFYYLRRGLDDVSLRPPLLLATGAPLLLRVSPNDRSLAVAPALSDHMTLYPLTNGEPGVRYDVLLPAVDAAWIDYAPDGSALYGVLKSSGRLFRLPVNDALPPAVAEDLGILPGLTGDPKVARMRIDPSGKFLYVLTNAELAGRIYQYEFVSATQVKALTPAYLELEGGERAEDLLMIARY